MTGKRDPYYTSPKFIGLCFAEYDRKLCADCPDIKECLEMGRKGEEDGISSNSS